MRDSSTSTVAPASSSGWPQYIGAGAGVSTSAVLVFLITLFVTYLSTFGELARTIWSTDEQGHGPLILGAAAWLLWTSRNHVFEGPPRPALKSGFALLLAAMAMFVVARSQAMIELETFSFVCALTSGFLLLHGARALRRAWFALFFLLFMVPLPGVVVQAITMPLKSAVSVVAEFMLYHTGYPIGRTGVTLTIGPYQLLVADACSGLNSLFTLESLGVLYMNVMNYHSKARNFLLAFMIVPISFVSNVTRVIILVLITYYFGDEAGQGFAHGFAGIVLFTVALILTYSFDRLLAARFDDKGGARGGRK